jgi:multiple antibiotic resistance protein
VLSRILFEFGTLFAIINPLGLAFVFLNRTMSLSDAEREIIARQVAIYSFSVLIVSLFAGTYILGFFGISIPALRIAGGLIVVASGWTMLNQSHDEDANGATSTQNLEAVRREAFFPLTVPLTAGPGTIATAITLGAAHPLAGGQAPAQLGSVLVAALVSLTIYRAYAKVSRLASLVGVEGTRVVMRLSAFLLMCVGVQIMLTGVTEALQPLLNLRGAQ